MSRKLNFLTAGESHGNKLVAILNGFPAGIKISITSLNNYINKRKIGFGISRRLKYDTTQARINSGVYNNITTGAPICLELSNGNFKKTLDCINIPQPGHVDVVGTFKYNHASMGISAERASARETVMRITMFLSPLSISHASVAETSASETKNGASRDFRCH